MLKLLLRWVINALSIWVASLIVDGIVLVGSIWQILLIALIFGLVNTLIKPLLQFFAAPIIVITVGFFTLLINAFLLWLTSLLSNILVVEGFWAAFWGALIISIISWSLSFILGE